MARQLDIRKSEAKEKKKRKRESKTQTGKDDTLSSTPASQVRETPLVPTDLKLSDEASTDTDSTTGLTDTVVCDSPEKLAEVFGLMVGDKLAYPVETVKLLESQLETYFSKMGWQSEDAVAATAGQPLPLPDTILDSVVETGLISPSVVMMLQNIARYIVPVRKRSLYLTKATSFDELELFNSRSHYGHLRRHDAAALTTGQTAPAGIESKLPSFQVPKFDGNTI